MLARPLSALIDLALPQATAKDEAALRQAAANLVQRKIRGMALPMRCAVGVLTFGFEYSALLTIGQRFSDAVPDKRRLHAMRAEAWPLVPFRELVRLVRAFTLMAFYDHPLTRQALGFRPGGSENV